MINLSNAELFAAKEIINIGLLKAADSLSFFMKEKLHLNGLDYSFNNTKELSDFTTKTGANIHLLITEVVGNVTGICFLIFSEEEADQLRKTALPPEILNSPEMMAEMGDGILLEVDNIISASIITQFSNLLQEKMHGDVPQLQKLDAEGVNKFIADNISPDSFFTNFKTSFSTEKVNFSPDFFMCLVDPSFIDSIRQFAADNNNIEMLRAKIAETSA